MAEEYRQGAQVVSLQGDPISESADIGDNLVSKSNALVDASSRLSLDEQRLIFSAISKIDSRPGKGRGATRITITGLEFAETWDLDPSNAYRQLYQAADNLYNQTIIFRGLGEERELRWIQEKIKYRKGSGEVTLVFSEGVSPYLTQLSGNFSSFKLANIRHLNSQHAQRLYELLNRFLDTGVRRFADLDDFRFVMALQGAYPVWKDLRRYVIEPALAEINRCTNICAGYAPIKRGRRVAGIEFTMNEQHQPDLFSRGDD